MAALPATSPAEFTVSWHGSDPVAGIAYYSIYVRDNGGAFASWIKTTTDTTATFQGQVGHTYGFYAIATDNAGNVEAIKSGTDQAVAKQ